MSRTRQTPAVPLEDLLVVRSLAVSFPDGLSTGHHRHDWPQLVYATEGVVSVSTEQGTWVVPPQRAVWVPAGMDHELVATGHVRLRTLYLRPDLAGALPVDCCVLSVSPLLREVILHVVAVGYLRDDDPAQFRLAGVLVDQLDPFREVPLVLTLPLDPRARRVAERLQADPSATGSLAELAEGSGASPRTLERSFRAETGMSFGSWRTRARLMFALRRLAERIPVTNVAMEAGYDSTSAFIAMFKRHLGTTPGKYFEHLEGK